MGVTRSFVAVRTRVLGTGALDRADLRRAPSVEHRVCRAAMVEDEFASCGNESHEAVFAKIAAAVALCVMIPGCSIQSSDEVADAVPSDFNYSTTAKRTCRPGDKPGAPAATDDLRTTSGLRYSVRAPANYDATYAHPLIVVFAAAGATARQSEAFTHLTRAATARGFVMAYVDHRRMSVEAIQQMVAIPRDVSNRWCIDTARVYAVGHSDGGTAATALALMPQTRGTFAAIVPSAAGFSYKDFDAFDCPAATPVMVLHGGADAVFPQWGMQAARRWAACNGCNTDRPMRSLGNTCRAYQDCTGAPTLYCEGSQSHTEWPRLEAQIVAFFEASHHMPP